jgi:AraC-like DNA-binding protein
MPNVALTIIILLFIGAAQGFLLSFTLVTLKRGNRTANRILSVLLFFFSCLIAMHAFGQLQIQAHHKDGEEKYSHTIFFIFGPLIYYYVKSLTSRRLDLHLRDILHLVPFLIFVLLYYFLGLFSPRLDYFIILNMLLPWLMMVQMTAYLISAQRVLRQYSDAIRNSFSSLEKINLNWLRFLMMCQFIIWPVAFFVEMVKTDPVQVNTMWLCISVFIYAIGYFGIRQPEIFTGQMQNDEPASQLEKKKYEKSSLTPEKSRQYLQRLQEYMQLEKPHLDRTITLQTLAEKLAFTTHELSQLINEQLNKNFFEFINMYRIDEAKAKIKDEQFNHLTIAAIGYESGFNSVSAFNAAFKKNTGITPSQYRQNQLSTNPSSS